VSRLFISHSSANNAEAVGLRDWLAAEGWTDVFLDLDPEKGIAAGERWERALNEAASRCEAVLFLVSHAWLNSRWCHKEFTLAQKLNKRLFGVLTDRFTPSDVPADLSGTWQLVDLASGQDHKIFSVTLPVTHRKCKVGFSREGLARLRSGLVKAGLDPRFFDWPPKSDPDRPPYRGLRPLEAEDAGIFFGRDSPIVQALDQLRGLRDATPPRLMVLLGASGAGKSSFLRAGLFARMCRDDRAFVPLPVMRPEQAAISGENGFVSALGRMLDEADIGKPRDELLAAVNGGAATLRPVLQELVSKKSESPVDEDARIKPPTLVISIDQGEELLVAEGEEEAQPLLALLRTLLIEDQPAVIIVIAIRSDTYSRLQETPHLQGIQKVLFDLGPMPRGAYAEVIKGPATRLEKSSRPLKIQDGLVDVLLNDIEASGAKDALPLLSFTLERLYLENKENSEENTQTGENTQTQENTQTGDIRSEEHKESETLTVAEYYALGGIKGSIVEAVERAFKAADEDPAVPNDRAARLALLRNGMIPWLATVDPDTRAPRRRVARLSEIPAECRPLLQHLVDQRLLTTDTASKTGEVTIEPAHEALLRQWDLLAGWLTEDAVLLAVLEGVKRASAEWIDSGRNPAWLAHSAGRLAAADRVSARSDLAANLGPPDREYLAACRKAESTGRRRKRRTRIAVYTMLIGIIIGLVGWINQGTIKEEINWFTRMRPYMMANYRPYRLSAAGEQALKPGDTFKECAKNCPEMVVIPAGEFTMGSPDTEPGRGTNEGPQHHVKIPHALAVSRFDVTFDDWDACGSVGGCGHAPDGGFGRGLQPAVNVTWDDAETYAKWLSKMTGHTYRLLTESEWEYAARGGTSTAYWWGNDLGSGNAACLGCGSKWDNKGPAPVGSFKPNPFGLYDMTGNVWQWIQDCYHPTYNGAPTDGSAWISGGDCTLRVNRGGSWITKGETTRVAYRADYDETNRNFSRGIRVVRVLGP
jgi:formylglycine-generating enzyme required for sulfatase activity